MFEITTESSFSAAHFLRNYSGPCENVHGHNWLVKATVRCEKLDAIGLGIDFKVLKSKLNDVLREFDHTDINRLFDPQNPSSENIARMIYGKLGALINNERCRVFRIDVFETPGNSSAYFE